METARARAEEIIEDGTQDAASYLAGLQRMASIKLSREDGRGMVNIVTDFVKRIQVRDARTKVMKWQQHLDQHEREKAYVRPNAEEEYRIDHRGGGYYGDYMDEDDLFHYRDRDSDDEEEEEIGTKDEEDFHSGRDSHH